MAINLDVFSSHVLPFVSGCPDSMVRMAVLEKAIELCERAGVWEVDLPLAAASTGLFAPVLPAGARIHLVKEVMRTPTRPLPENAYKVHGDWTSISFHEPQVAELAPTFTVKASLVPTRITVGQQTNELPDTLVERFLSGLSAGAKSYLMVMPGQAWSNPQLAAYFQREFDQVCGTAAAETLHGRAANSQRVQYRPFR